MAVIIPAILPASREDLLEKLAQLSGVTTEAQIDVVDGKFAGPATWPYLERGTDPTNLGTLPEIQNLHVEVDLMVEEPEQMASAWIGLGATRVLLHVESTNYLPLILTNLKVKHGHTKGFTPGLLSFGLAVNIATDFARLEPYLGDIDYVQFMGIKNIGKQGQPFATEVLNRIAVFRARHPEVPIQVDGGVNSESAVLLLRAGVSRLVVGSALWKAGDFKYAYDQFMSLTETHGLYE
ncbi:MAG: hypothetical protein AAB472_03235 [Patescibacteria group bacterium]